MENQINIESTPQQSQLPSDLSQGFNLGLFGILLLPIILIIFFLLKGRKSSGRLKFWLKTTAIVLFVWECLLFLTWSGCLDNRCDMLGESLVTSFVLAPILGVILLIWFIYFLRSYFKK